MNNKQKITKTLLMFVLAYAVPAQTSAQEKVLKNDAAVKTGLLKNGFRYFIRHNEEPKGRATIYLANRVGSLLERDEEQGIAHFLEHMNFNGTKHFPKNELISYLERSGVKFGADLNAYTSYNETVYQLPLPTDDKKLWHNGMQIMRDWAADATLDQAEFERERGVIQEEKRLGGSASGRMSEKYRPLLYNYSRYADRMPIGKDAVIQKADVSVARNFYKKWYRPNLQALIVVGDVDITAVEKQITSLFSDLQMPKQPVPHEQYTIALKDSSSYLKVTDPEFGQYGMQWYFKRKGNILKTENDFRTELVQQLTNVMYATRLRDVANRTAQPYVSARGQWSALPGNLDVLELRVALNPEKIREGFHAFWTEMVRINRFGFTAEELQMAKERMTRSMEVALSEKDKVSSTSYADDYLQYFLNGKAYLSVEERDQLVKRLISAVHIGDIQQELLKFLGSKDQTVILMGPEKGKDMLPDRQELVSWQKAVEAEPVKAYQADNTTAALLAQMPVPGKIVKEEQLGKTGILHWVLNNGMNIYVKPTAFKNDEILFSGFSRGGISLYNDADFNSAKNAVPFITSSGLGRFNAGQLAQILANKAMQVKPYITDRAEGFSGASSTRDLSTALEMVHLYMTAPRIDTARFSKIMEQSKSAFRNRVPDAQRDFTDTINYVLSGYHLRRKPMAITNLEQIDSARVQAIFKERFANPSDFTFVFTGNVNVDSLKTLVCRNLGSVPVKGVKESAKDLHIRVPEGQLRKDLRGSKADKASVQLVLSGNYAYGTKSNLYLSLLKAALQFRLTNRLREGEGGVYSPAVYLTKAKEPVNFYALTVSFECDPAKMEQLIKATKEEIDLLSRNGSTSEDLQKFVAEESRSHQLQLRSNEYWLGTIQNHLEGNLSIADELEYPASLKGLSTKESVKFSKQFLNQQNEIIFTLRP